MKISIVGFGKLGSSTGLFLSNKKNEIFAYDVNHKILRGFEKNSPLFYEKSAKHLIKNNKINYCYNIVEAIKESNLTYLVLPTPSIPKNNNFDPSFIFKAIDKIFPIIKKKKNKHTIIITSTVSPGTCEKIEKYIKTKFNLRDYFDYRLIYNPYFIALGSIINDLENPDLLLIGCDNRNKTYYGNYLKKIYKNKIKNIKLNFLKFKEAEISKLAINCYVTMKISFSNSLSQIADIKENNIDTSKILKAIGSDTRIGNKYLALGPMFSGPCFPRDNLAMSAYFKYLKISEDLFSSTDLINNMQTKRFIKLINKINKSQNKKIGFLGLTYKSGTDLFTDSPAFYIIDKLTRKIKDKVSGYDPYFNKSIKKNLSRTYKIAIYDTLDDFMKNSDVVFLSYRDKKFNYATKYKNKILIDPWNFFNKNLSKSKIICPGISD